MYLRVSAVLACCLATVTAAAPSAFAGDVSPVCGTTVTTDLVLHKDLTCVGTALRFVVTGGATLHIDLNGHRLKGDGTGVGIESMSSEVNPGNLEVTDGSIVNFAAALLGTQRPRSVTNLNISDVRMAKNGTWLPKQVRRAVTITDSTIVNSGIGGAYTDSASLTVRNSRFVDSSIWSSSESFNYLYDSSFTGGGFYAGPSSNVVAIGNMFSHCDIGIELSDFWPKAPTTVEDNVFNECKTGVVFGGMGGPVSVQRNIFLDNTGPGMTFTSLPFLNATISGNKFLRNAGDGIVGSGVTPSVPASVVVVSGNRAYENTGHGINVSNISDGGNNRARRNETPAQCVGVACP